MITYNSHPKIMFLFNLLAIVWRREGGLFENGRPRSKGWKNFGRSRPGGEWGVMDVMCVSSLNTK